MIYQVFVMLRILNLKNLGSGDASKESLSMFDINFKIFMAALLSLFIFFRKKENKLPGRRTHADVPFEAGVFGTPSPNPLASSLRSRFLNC
mgnify:CR=1 FL=1